MDILTVQPIVYEGPNLEDITESIVKAFWPKLIGYEVKNEIKLDAIDDSLFDIPPPEPVLNSSYVINRYRSFNTNNLIITTIPMVYYQRNSLERDYGGPKFFRREGLGMGTKNGALVSLPLILKENMDAESQKNALIKLGIHELGHSFGLKHHYSTQRVDDKLCIMTNYHSFLIENNMEVDNPGSFKQYHPGFCDDCYRGIGISPVLKRNEGLHRFFDRWGTVFDDLVP